MSESDLPVEPNPEDVKHARVHAQQAIDQAAEAIRQSARDTADVIRNSTRGPSPTGAQQAIDSAAVQPIDIDAISTTPTEQANTVQGPLDHEPDAEMTRRAEQLARAMKKQD